MSVAATLTLRVGDPGGIDTGQFKQLLRERYVELASRARASHTGGQGATRPNLKGLAFDSQFLGDQKSAVGGPKSSD